MLSLCLRSVCPQHDILFDSLTVREHLEFYGALKGVAAQNLTQAIDTKLAETGLTEKADAMAGTLSGGQKRKLSVCIALIGDSRIVFLDEPTCVVPDFVQSTRLHTFCTDVCMLFLTSARAWIPCRVA